MYYEILDLIDSIWPRYFCWSSFWNVNGWFTYQVIIISFYRIDNEIKDTLHQSSLTNEDATE